MKNILYHIFQKESEAQILYLMNQIIKPNLFQDLVLFMFNIHSPLLVIKFISLSLSLSFSLSLSLYIYYLVKASEYLTFVSYQEKSFRLDLKNFKIQVISVFLIIFKLRVNHNFDLSLIHISEPTRLGMISYAVFCLKKKKNHN
eukprot:TRINITY_DN9334_c0_g1_i1.p1 TRINITY_DN9334_c0_g1~~TRINITY_DN9334_c0_g1_i1.p1  ORF type:complete len:144 (+),score=12.01 TRINITY_DN9334_c0_g1_i1:130-561(+)